ncbi:MAG: phosphatase PAP2 family protein, partial [Micromonosporaceae bacterium]
RGAWPRRLIWWAPVLVVGLASTYLGYHWVTDVIAGLVLGLIVVRLVRRQLWRRLRFPPGWSRCT